MTASRRDTFPAGQGPIANFEVHYLSSEIVSVSVQVVHFGASANAYIEGVLYDVENDALLSPADLFRPDVDWQEEAARIVCRELFDGDVRAECDGLGDQLRAVGRVVTNGTGLVFLFDECEVMMCAGGTPTVTVDWDKLDPILRHNDPIRPLLAR